MAILRADKLMESVLGLDQTGIGQLRNVEYAKKYLWEVSFGGNGEHVLPPPSPFTNFFPATDIDMDEATLDSYKYEQYMSTYEIPHKTSSRYLNLTFNDNEDNVIFKWLSDWINIDILNFGHFMSALLDDHMIVDPQDPRNALRYGTDTFGEMRRVVPLRQVKISLLSSNRTKVLTRTFLVFPVGKLPFNGNQASQAQSYTMSFAIVREVHEKVQADKASALDNLKAASIDLLGRFI